MALPISQGSGATIATESISGQHYSYTKLTDASLGGSATVGMIVDSGANASGAAHVFLRGNVTLSDPKGFIGLVSIAQPISTTFSGNVTLDPGSKTAIVGNVTLSDPKTFIGSVSVGGLVDSKGFIGLVTTQAADPKGFIGLVTVGAMIGNITLSDSKGYIGLVTIGGMSTVTLADPKGYIGLVTVGGIGTVTLADPKGFIGLVTIGNKASLQKTVQTELKSIASLAPYMIDKSSVLNVSTTFSTALFIDYAPVSTSIPSIGAQFIIEGSEKASGNETWRPLQTFFTGNAAASLASTVAGGTAANATVAQILSNTGFSGGDLIYFANVTTIINSEWARVGWISAASVVLEDGLTNVQDSTGVWNKAQQFIAQLDVSPYQRVRVVAHNALFPGLPITINWRVAALTADTVG
jgi:hypothetical protein